MNKTVGTFDSFVRTNPKAVDWMLNNYHKFELRDSTDPYYKTNNYRRAYASNELAHYHPDGYQSSYSNRDI
jgi:hypothetical protein